MAANRKIEVRHGLDGSISVSERSLYQSAAVQRQLQAARDLAEALGLLKEQTQVEPERPIQGRAESA